MWSNSLQLELISEFVHYSCHNATRWNGVVVLSGHTGAVHALRVISHGSRMRLFSGANDKVVKVSAWSSDEDFSSPKSHPPAVALPGLLQQSNPASLIGLPWQAHGSLTTGRKDRATGIWKTPNSQRTKCKKFKVFHHCVQLQIHEMVLGFG